MSSDLQEQAKRHLWMHFTRMGSFAEPEHEVPVIVRGEGCYVYDEHGKRHLDGLSALYCVNIGHGRPELGEAAAAQSKELAFYTNWSYAHPRSIELTHVSWAQRGVIPHRPLHEAPGSSRTASGMGCCNPFCPSHFATATEWIRRLCVPASIGVFLPIRVPARRRSS